MCDSRSMSAPRAQRTAIVTGATRGIGLEVARGLARAGDRVILACRDLARGDAVCEAIRREIPGASADALELDAASRSSIGAFARAVSSRFSAVHVLVNNAGIWLDRREENADGIELVWATNVLGYHRVTESLLDLLKASAPARIVNVTSVLARGLDLEDVEFRRRRFDGMAAYAQSKQANRMLTWTLAERLAGSGVTANAIHPGTVQTDLLRNTTGFRGAVSRVWFKVLGTTSEKAAAAVVHLASSPEVEGLSGHYWSKRRQAVCPYRDPTTNARLEALCREMSSR
jgi:retinol dehydrogenase-12